MDNFKNLLEDKLKESYYNDFGIENYDEYRFGSYTLHNNIPLEKAKKIIKKIIQYNKKDAIKPIQSIEQYIEKLEFLWQNLNGADKKLLIDIIAYRLTGFTKIKLPLNTSKYWEDLEKLKSLKDPKDTYDPHFLHMILEKFNLKSIGYDIQLYFSELGVAIDFMIEQYAYKDNDRYVIHAEKDDVVLDIGGCWGDTALYFAHKVGADGRVYSFEFIPDNIKLYNLNVCMNPHLKSHIELIEHPVSDVSDQVIYFKDNGPGSKILDKPFPDQTGSTTTLSIDDFVKRNNISKVDYIKMDIEGAEPYALKGAIETIKKFKPKLAIATYHSMDDFVNIPAWILALDLGYEIYIGHYTIHVEETICFAKSKK